MHRSPIDLPGESGPRHPDRSRLATVALPNPSTAAAPSHSGDDAAEIRLSSVMGGLSYALDLAEGQPAGHAIRTTLIGMKIAEVLGIDETGRSGLFYGLLLKDLGCSSNAARLTSLFGSDDHLLKQAHKLTDWTATGEAARYVYRHSLPGESRLARAWHALVLGARGKGIVRELTTTRSERGAEIATLLGLPMGSVSTIRGLDEHWDGSGMPKGLVGTAAPILPRIAGLAQSVEVFARAFDLRTAYDMARSRAGRWFDPILVEALTRFELDAPFWDRVQGAESLLALSTVEPAENLIYVGPTQLDQIAEGFALVIDAKSPFTAGHSQRVAELASRTAVEMGLPPTEVNTIRRAALLHDIGMLGVSNRILDKAGTLDPVERQLVQQHTRYTFEILAQVSRFRTFAATAASHHERLDGSGYHLGLRHEEIGMASRILAVADTTVAMMADRAYRSALGLDEALGKLRKLAARGCVSAEVTEALLGWFRGFPESAGAEGSPAGAGSKAA